MGWKVVMSPHYGVAGFTTTIPTGQNTVVGNCLVLKGGIYQKKAHKQRGAIKGGHFHTIMINCTVGWGRTPKGAGLPLWDFKSGRGCPAWDRYTAVG